MAWRRERHPGNGAGAGTSGTGTTTNDAGTSGTSYNGTALTAATDQVLF